MVEHEINEDKGHSQDELVVVPGGVVDPHGNHCNQKVAKAQ